MVAADVGESMITLEILDRPELNVTQGHEAEKVVLLHNHRRLGVVLVDTEVIIWWVPAVLGDAIGLEVLLGVEGLVEVLVGVCHRG